MNPELINFNYNDQSYVLVNDKDPSIKGGILEIVTRDEYSLSIFQGIKGSIFDIGANNGIATLILAKQNPDSIIYAFEPCPNIFARFQKNLELNKIINVRAFNVALSSKDNDEIELFLHPWCSGANTTFTNKEIFKNVPTVKVKTRNLDSFIDENNIKEIELLKIDCEGAEFDILYNSTYFKEKKFKNLVGEFHDLKWNKKSNYSLKELDEFSRKCIDGFYQVQLLKI